MTVTAYLIVSGAAAALDFYRDAFGAVETERMVGDDGRIGHAEFVIGDSTLMIADEYPEVDAVGPASRGGPTCAFTIEVADAAAVDATFATAVALGATATREPTDQFHGSRQGTVTDPFGHRWTLSALIENLTAEEYAARAADTDHGSYTVERTGTESAVAGHQLKVLATGDLYYFTLPVQDMARAQRFFGSVFGWQFGAPDEGHISNISAPPGGVNTGTADTGARLWFVVDDIHAVAQRVRDLGGTAEEPVHYDSGWSSNCTDDQGTVFSLSVPSPKYSA